jgi:hypothetical protein
MPARMGRGCPSVQCGAELQFEGLPCRRTHLAIRTRLPCRAWHRMAGGFDFLAYCRGAGITSTGRCASRTTFSATEPNMTPVEASSRASLPRHRQAGWRRVQPALPLLLLSGEGGALPGQRVPDGGRGPRGEHPGGAHHAPGPRRDDHVAGRGADADGPVVLRARGRCHRSRAASGAARPARAPDQRRPARRPVERVPGCVWAGRLLQAAPTLSDNGHSVKLRSGDPVHASYRPTRQGRGR